MIETVIHNLQRGKKLLLSIDDIRYSDTSVAPYYSSIGGHMRHILDIFDCIFKGLDAGKIDLTKRERNVSAEEKVEFGISYLEHIIEELQKLQGADLNRMVEVTDDLGSGKVSVNYTLASVLIQAHSHAIHHFASLGYVIHRLGIELPDADFGYNPTTPRNKDLQV